MNDLFSDYRKENSREARVKSAPKANTDSFRIWRCINDYGKPIHAKHIAQLIDIDYHAIQRRLSELVRAGKIKVVGKQDGYTTYESK